MQYTSSSKTLTYTLNPTVSSVAVFATNSATEFYRQDWTKSTGQALTSVGGYNGAAGSDLTQYAIFAGGRLSGVTTTGMEYRNSAGVGSTATNPLGTARYYMGGATSNAAAIFASGELENGSFSSIVDYRSGAGVGGTSTDLFTATINPVSVNGCSGTYAQYALFHGGGTYNTGQNAYKRFSPTGVTIGGSGTIGVTSALAAGTPIQSIQLVVGGINSSSNPINQNILFPTSGSPSLITTMPTITNTYGAGGRAISRTNGGTVNGYAGLIVSGTNGSIATLFYESGSSATANNLASVNASSYPVVAASAGDCVGFGLGTSTVKIGNSSGAMFVAPSFESFFNWGVGATAKSQEYV